MANIIGTIKEISGASSVAVEREGTVVYLNAGDSLFAGDKIKSLDYVKVDIQYSNGEGVVLEQEKDLILSETSNEILAKIEDAVSKKDTQNTPSIITADSASQRVNLDDIPGVNRETETGSEPLTLSSVNTAAIIPSLFNNENVAPQPEGINTQKTEITTVGTDSGSSSSSVPQSVPPSNLSVDLSMSTDTPTMNQAMQGTVMITNAGIGSSSAVIVKVTAPDFMEISNISDGGVFSNGEIEWQLGDLAASTSKEVTFTATPKLGVALEDTNFNAEVTSSSIDTNLADNSLVHPIDVQDAALQITSSVSSTTPVVNQMMTLSYTVSNAGNDTATGIAVTLTLPVALTLNNVIPSQGTYDSSTGIWTIGSLVNGANATLNITATPTNGTSFNAVATISNTSAHDANLANNSVITAINPNDFSVSRSDIDFVTQGANQITKGNVITGVDSDDVSSSTIESNQGILTADYVSTDTPTAIRTIEHNDITYTLNSAGTAVTAVNSSNQSVTTGFNYSNDLLTINSTENNGQFSIYLGGSNIGQYTYTSPTSFPNSTSFSIATTTSGPWVNQNSYTFNASDADPTNNITITALDFSSGGSGSPTTPFLLLNTSGADGLGVESNNNPSDRIFRSEGLNIQFQSPVHAVTFTLADMTGDQYLHWTAIGHDSAGTAVTFEGKFAPASGTGIDNNSSINYFIDQAQLSNSEIQPGTYVGLVSIDSVQLRVHEPNETVSGFGILKFNQDFVLQGITATQFPATIDDSMPQDVFNYTLQDADGDKSTASLTVGINFAGDMTTISGTTGNDTLTGTSSDNLIIDTQGADTLIGNAGNDVLITDAKALSSSGTTDALPDILRSGDGNDVLIAGGGADTLEGGKGDDWMKGGAGADTFKISLDATNTGHDTIVDFNKDSDILRFTDVLDTNGDSQVNLGDVEAKVTSITDTGVGGNVDVTFNTGAAITFTGVGTGTTDSLSDLVVQQNQIQVTSGSS